MEFLLLLAFITFCILIGWVFRKKEVRKPYVEEALGHNHEWDDMYHTNENGQWVHKKEDGYSWAFCWICGAEEKFKEKDGTV